MTKNDVLYPRPMPNYGDLFTKEEFQELVECGSISDYDGTGYPAKDGYLSSERLLSVEVIPEDANQVAWFNK